MNTAVLSGLTAYTAYCAAVSATAVGASGNSTGQWGTPICAMTEQSGIVFLTVHTYNTVQTVLVQYSTVHCTC